MTSEFSANERVFLERRIRELEAENLRLSLKSQEIATANVHAAMQMVEISENRSRELEAKNGEIAAALAMAEQASRHKSLFLANMSHELRTPISGIIGMADLLASSSLTPQQRDRLDAIVTTAESFLDLVNQLLEFSKAEANAIELEDSEFDLWRLSEGVAQLLHVSAEQKGIEFVFQQASDLPRIVRGDSLRIRQVALNLGANAVKFTERGLVLMDVSCEAAADGACTVLIRISDTGCGFDEATGQRLFRPFSQADVSTTRRFGGTGLGLAICDRLVGAMGGRISYASEPDRGTTFEVRLTLPVVHVAPVAAEVRKTARLVTARPAIRSMLRAHLPRYGFRVEDCSEEDAPPADLLVLEPAIDAERALRRLRAADPKTPVLLVACPGRMLSDEELSELGVVGVLQPPLRATQLAALLGGDPSSRPEAGSTAGLVEGMRVLVADDSSINQRILLAHLQQMGCQVELANDGSTAVEALRRGSFELVFMDCQMPQMDGYAAAAAIREIEAAAGRTPVPIVALTADASPGNRERCDAAGMDDFCLKPLRAHQLRNVLSRWRSQRA